MYMQMGEVVGAAPRKDNPAPAYLVEQQAVCAIYVRQAQGNKSQTGLAGHALKDPFSLKFGRPVSGSGFSRCLLTDRGGGPRIDQEGPSVDEVPDAGRDAGLDEINGTLDNGRVEGSIIGKSCPGAKMDNRVDTAESTLKTSRVAQVGLYRLCVKTSQHDAPQGAVHHQAGLLS